MLAISIKIKITTCLLILSIHMQVQAQFTPLTKFGDNPGELTASYYEPASNSKNLVVLLHGCVQNGEEFAKSSGFLGIAKNNNFTLLIPQQIANNNVKTCFNWFSTHDINKDQGESLSIKNMIVTLKEKTKSDNIFIAGLSAGGAMTSVMLVNYPEIFNAAAIIAGIPFPCADNLTKAISCMRNGPSQTTNNLVNKVEDKKVNVSSWPNLTIFTGSDDKIVNPKNSIALAQQWAGLKGLTVSPMPPKQQQGVKVKRWQSNKNKGVVELVTIAGLDHGMPINSSLKNGGIKGPFLLESPISAAINIVKNWQLSP